MTSLEAEIQELEQQLRRAAPPHAPWPLTLEWLQQRVMGWATSDPHFRVQLLRLVDVLPALRSASAIADHVRQYLLDTGPPPLRLTAGLTRPPLARSLLSRTVREAVLALAHRFIAGEDMAAALPRLHALAEQGTAHTVDLLGEATLSDAEADAYLARYRALLEDLAVQRDAVAPTGERWQGVPSINISIKLSALCARMEPAAPAHMSKVLRARLRPLLRLARELDAFVNIDLEQYRYKGLAYETFWDLMLEPEFADATGVGIVVQAYLQDAQESLERLRRLAERRGHPFSVRLVKGAYWDEERVVASQNSWQPPVYRRKPETDASFERCSDALLAAWPHLRPVFGTHNPRSIAQAMVKARHAGIDAREVEFQMLLGMSGELQAAVHAAGYRTRVYVPVGEVIPGMAYLVRRLLENTSNEAWFNERTGLGPRRGGRGPEVSSRRPAVAQQAGGFRNAPTARFFDPAARAAMAEALGRLREDFGVVYPLLIGQEAIAGRSYAEVRYPAEPEVVVGRVAQATRADVEAAVTIARRGFEGWRARPAAERARLLRRAAEIMEERRFELAATMVYESGKPWAEADGDVVEAMDYLRYYGQEAERLSTSQRLGDVLGEHNDYFYEGRGVAAIIAPWNFPLAIITGMSAAALAGGNAAILKPAAQSPVVAAKLVEILREAGLPPEVVHYLPGRGDEVGNALVEHPGVDIIAFTGSNVVGLSIIARAAQAQAGQRTIKRVIAELGGKNAIVVDDDADLDEALAGIITSAFGYAGQKCSAASRLIVVGSAYQDCLERLRHGVESLVVGPPHDPATFVPPVIGAAAQERILGHVEAGRSAARLLVQGKAPADSGYYVPPTVFTGVPPESPLACDEIFGPVLSVFHASSFAEALDLATASSFALTGGLYSRNPRHMELARRHFRVGNLYINRKITGAMVGRQPFGGLAMSGFGEKAGGPDYLRQFMEPRVVTENTMRRGYAAE
ncbi:MAG: bifunctional proline dehydrogenase/L-glutamate gamma-semialdehyde dehydrogenase [Chloroflexi bacterium]|nr:bifunctional proline dehydrogenase/L-glutamate gamma-semialdehyde dehydrogenase [Chloroflexota bacterium]